MQINAAILGHFLAREEFTVEQLPAKLSPFKIFSTSKPSGIDGILSVVDLTTARSLNLSESPAMVLVKPGDSTGGIPSTSVILRTSETPQDVCDRLNLRIATLADWIDTMSLLAEGKGNCGQIIESSETVIGHYVGLSDALYLHVAHTPHIDPIDDMSRSLCETGRYPDEMLSTVARVAAEQQWDSQTTTTPNLDGSLINPFPSVNRIIRRKGRYAAHLVMVSHSRLTEGEIQLFDILADKVEACLQRQWQNTDPSIQPYTKFLEALYAGTITQPKQIEGQARRYDLEVEGVFEVCIIHGAHRRGGVDHFARRIRNNVPNSLVTLQGNDICVLLRRGAKKSQSISSMEKHLSDLVVSLDATMGLSGKFYSLQWAHIAHRQAEIALKYGAKNCKIYSVLLEKDPDLFHVFRFKRYFPCYIADPSSDSGDFLEEFKESPNPINRVRAADAENGTDDFNLLRVYLFCDGNVKETASLMNMHRNTVTYRLGKIRNEFRIDLDDGDTRLFLHFVFAVMD